MRRVGVLVEGYTPRTALETVDLALAVGLLDIEVVVLLRGEGCRHLQMTDETVRGRWRTLLDYCPARLCVAAASRPADIVTAAGVQTEELDNAAFAREIAACDHILLGYSHAGSWVQ